MPTRLIMRPSSLGWGRIMRRTLSVCMSVCLSVSLSVRLSVRPVIVFVYFTVEPSYERTSKIEKKTFVFAYGPASRMYFSARAEGRISYGHLGRTNSYLRLRNASWKPCLETGCERRDAGGGEFARAAAVEGVYGRRLTGARRLAVS